MLLQQSLGLKSLGGEGGTSEKPVSSLDFLGSQTSTHLVGRPQPVTRSYDWLVCESKDCYYS